MGQKSIHKKQTAPETPKKPKISVETLERDTNLTFLYLMRQAVLADRITRYQEIQKNPAAKVGFASHPYINQTVSTDDEIQAIIDVLSERREKLKNDFPQLNLANHIDVDFAENLTADEIKSILLAMKLSLLDDANKRWNEVQKSTFSEFFNKIMALYIDLYRVISHIHSSLYGEMKEILIDLNAIFNDYLYISIYSGSNTPAHAEDFSTKIMPIFENIQSMSKLKSADIDEHIRIKREFSLDFLKHQFKKIQDENFLKGLLLWRTPSTPLFSKAPSTTVTPETPAPRQVNKRAVGGLVTVGLLAVAVLVIAAIFSLPIFLGVLGTIAGIGVVGVGIFAYYHRKASQVSAVSVPVQEMQDFVSEGNRDTHAMLTEKMQARPGKDKSVENEKPVEGLNNNNNHGGVHHENAPHTTAKEAQTIAETCRPSYF